MARELRLPEPCRLQLVALHNQAALADERFRTAIDIAVAAVGLDPVLKHSVNIETGVITAADGP